MARAGPTNSQTLFDIPTSAFASWISRSGTVCGTTAVEAGRKNASAVPNSASITATCQISTSPVMISAARAAWRAKRTRSVTTISRWRGTRSAQTPPISMNPTSGTAWAARTMPRSVGSPVRSMTNSASATVTIRSPSTLARPASQSSRKSRWRRVANRSVIALIVSTDRGSGGGRPRRGVERARMLPTAEKLATIVICEDDPTHPRGALREPRGRSLRAARRRHRRGGAALLPLRHARRPADRHRPARRLGARRDPRDPRRDGPAPPFDPICRSSR